MDPFDPAAAAHDRFSASAEAGSGTFDGVVEECHGSAQADCPTSCWWCVERSVCAAHPNECLAAPLLAHGPGEPVAAASSSAWVMVLVAVLGVGLVAALFVTNGWRRGGGGSHAGRLSPVDMELSTSFDRADEQDDSWRGLGSSGAALSTPPPRSSHDRRQQPKCQPEGRRLLDDD